MKIKIRKPGFPQVTALFIYTGLLVDSYRIIANYRLPFLSSTVPTLRNIIYIALFLFIIGDLYKKNQINKPIIISVVFSLLYLITYMVYEPLRSVALDGILMLFSRLVPAYCIMRYNTNWDETCDAIYRLKYFIIIYVALILLYPDSIITGYSTTSFNLFLPTLVVLYLGIKRKKTISILVAASGLLYVAILGGRAALFCAIISIVLFILYSLRKAKGAKKIILYFTVIAVTIVLVFSFDEMVQALYKQYPDSRTLMYLSKDDFFKLNNRNLYYDVSISELSEHPFKVRGILADRLLFTNKIGNIDSSSIGSRWAHNIILEVLVQFGLLFGGVFVIVEIVKLVKSYIAVNRVHDEALVLLYFAVVPSFLLKGLITATYLDYQIWLAIGMISSLCDLTIKWRKENEKLS